MAKAKTISLLLNDGTLKGVISMEDSSWNKGELYSAPRESVDDLILSDACSRYGVYLLLSEDMVYIGQASDLAKRIKQHLIGKSWWERVVILTTSDDSLNRSDIDYIEANLISKASEIGRLDCDNKNMGNKQKVTKFRAVELEQYLEEALFLLELIGVNVFCKPVNNQIKSKLIPSVTNSTKEQLEIREKREALQFLVDNGITIGNNVNYSKCMKNHLEFWIEPQKSAIDTDWYMILNNQFVNEIIVLHIPSKTFSINTGETSGLILRKDNPKILSKIKNNRNSEAYVIGELYVDIFEQDGLADMAISNRRGYEENDPRYIEVIKIAKRLLGYIVGQKDIVSKRRKEDDQRIEDEKIKKKFWENPQTREILELRLNDAEKQVVQEENLQFTRAVNNGKQTKKIFISHKEVHKLYGQFIVDVLETYGVDVVSTIIFTGDRRLGVPQGKDIYDYLKDCFREDLMVIFLFSKAFYDSNICISEAGAAWATNQNCMNVVIDISFSDIEKPSNNALSSIKFQQIRTPDQTITVTEFFKTIIEEGLHLEYDESKLQKALNDVLETDKYSDQKIDFPATFLPKRKFLPVPRCSKCHNIMLLTEENGRLKYVCSNVSCDECYEAVIN